MGDGHDVAGAEGPEHAPEAALPDADPRAQPLLLEIDQEGADRIRDLEKRRRARTLQLLQSPGMMDDLRILHAALLPERLLMQAMMDQEQVHWDFEQLHRLHTNLECSSRLQELRREDSLLDKMLTHCFDILSGADPQAAANVAANQGVAKKLFVTALRSAALVHENYVRLGQTFPLKLILLLSEPGGAEQLLRESRCCMDLFSQTFVARFSSLALLQSPACQAIIQTLQDSAQCSGLVTIHGMKEEIESADAILSFLLS